MTDEEKAEEHTKENYCKKCHLKDCSRNKEVSCYVMHYNDFLDGLAEGRKESCEVCEKESNKEYQKLFDKQREIIERLEIENAELKAKIERLKPLVCEHKADITSCYDDITRLTNENEQLKDQNENKRVEIKMLRNEHLQDMEIHNNYVNKVEELKAQIEKMKCCGNCKNCNGGSCELINCKYQYVEENREVYNEDKWELAE